MEQKPDPPFPPLILSPSNSLRRRSNDSSSPEFQFWSNPSFPNSDLLSADELFSDGVLLPLHLLHLSNTHHQPQPPTTESSDLLTNLASSNEQEPGSDSAPVTEPELTAELSSSIATSNSALTSSKRWVMDIFKKSDKKTPEDINQTNNSAKEKNRGDKKKNSGVVSVGKATANSAELNINIWPFSRSRSAGNGGNRPRSTAAASRKVSSAPCSRSNSRGESKSKKWPNSPNRAGVHLGKSSPVWQARRSVKRDGNEDRRKVVSAGGGGGGGGDGCSKGRVLSLNVPMCIGYRQHMSCGGDENIAIGATINEGAPIGEGGVRGSNLFKIRGLFTSKKVY